VPGATVTVGHTGSLRLVTNTLPVAGVVTGFGLLLSTVNGLGSLMI